MPPDSSVPPSDDPRKPAPRGVRAELSRFIENWLERAEEATNGDGGSLELAAVFGFLRRTDPALLPAAEWDRLREQIEKTADELLRSEPLRIELRAKLLLARTRAESELSEFFQLCQAREQRKASAAPLAEERMDALRIAERIDAVFLAGGFALNQGDDTDAARAIEALSARAALSGENFHAIAGWFAAMERSIDPAFLPDRFYWRGIGMRGDDRALLASAAWIQTTHARIRAYLLSRTEVAADERAQRARSRQLAALEQVDAREQSNTARWRLVGQEFSDDIRAGARRFAESSMQLVQALVEGATPRLAAARAPRASGGETSLEWSSPEGERVARCSFDPAAGVRSLLIEFFSSLGETDRSFDGQSVSWLGTTVTVANGRADFAADVLRSSASPLDTLRRSAALFVGGTLWNARFATEDDDDGDDDDEAQL